MLEVRKHVTQMTSFEKALLNEFLTNEKYKIGLHAIKREKEKVISRESIFRAIHNGSIVEYHYKNSNRILVRGNVDEGGFNVCAVVNLTEKEIVTVYDNEINDRHYTLNKSLYSKHFDIASMFKGNKSKGKTNTYVQ